MKKILMMILLPLILLTACVDSLEDFNKDQKRASAVPPPTLFSNALKGMIDIITTPNVNSNNYRMFVQHWATTTYLDEPRYSMTSRLYSQNFWNAVYRDVLSDLKESKRLINLDAVLDPAIKNNQLGIIGIMEVYSWNALINTFGSVPYTEALDSENLLPDYDNAETIYNDLLARLDASLALLTPSATSLGTADLIYGGSVAKWVKFGNSLKLKMGMTLADKEPAKAKTIVEQAVAGGLLTSADNARFPYVSGAPNNNPISTNLNPLFTSREDFVIANTIVDAMNTTSDPRRQFYFTHVNGVFIGGSYGNTNTFAKFSHVSTKIAEPTFEGLLMDYAEIEFLLAEAVERGFNVGGTAKDHYTAAITASMKYWGAEEGNPLKQKAIIHGIAAGGTGHKVDDILTVVGGISTVATQFKVSTVAATTGEITAVSLLTAGEYSVPPSGVLTTATSGTGTGATLNVVYDGGISTYLARTDVDYTTATGSYKQKIGTQKWIALNNRGWEAWTEWRRLDFPVLTPPLPSLKIPMRMIYPPSEATANTAPWEAAKTALGGEDSPNIKIFWDVN